MAKSDQPQRAMRQGIPLEVERWYVPQHIAMLQSLRVVLGMSRMPITLNEESEAPVISNDSAQGERPNLAIYAK